MPCQRSLFTQLKVKTSLSMARGVKSTWSKRRRGYSLYRNTSRLPFRPKIISFNWSKLLECLSTVLSINIVRINILEINTIDLSCEKEFELNPSEIALKQRYLIELTMRTCLILFIDFVYHFSFFIICEDNYFSIFLTKRFYVRDYITQSFYLYAILID